MEIFLKIFTEMSSLYLIIFLGFLSGKYFKVDTNSIATLTVFVISPIVFMLSVAKMEFTVSALVIPLIIACIGTVLSFVTVNVGKLYMGDKAPYLSALTAGTCNWGYFGLPIAFSIFDPDHIAIYVLMGFGTHLFENSFGVYFISRGNFSPLESLKNVLKFPVLYAILIGLLLSFFNVELPSMTETFFQYFKGAYVILGMMIIGLGLSDLERFTVDGWFVGTITALKFVIWPLIAVALIWCDQHIFMALSESFYKPLLLLSIMPMGANNIAYAAKFDMRPGKAAVACLITTLLAMFYVPFMINFLQL